MIKLIASDIDGTLVHDGTHELNPELCDVILQLKEKGIQFAAASGRQWASIEDLFDPIKERIFYLILRQSHMAYAEFLLQDHQLVAAFLLQNLCHIPA